MALMSMIKGASGGDGDVGDFTYETIPMSDGTKTITCEVNKKYMIVYFGVANRNVTMGSGASDVQSEDLTFTGSGNYGKMITFTATATSVQYYINSTLTFVGLFYLS